MRLLLHAITTAEVAPTIELPEFRPGYGHVARVADGQGLTAWASVVHDEAEPFTREDLLSEHALVSVLHEATDACLPGRFPTFLSDEDALRVLLVRQGPELQAALERVRGRAELAVTTIWATPAEPSAPDMSGSTPQGTRYLRARQRAFAGSDAQHARAKRLSEELESQSRPELVEARHVVCPSPRIALSSALLVPRRTATDLKARLARVEPDVRILVNGPWPPYTFAAGIVKGGA
jgi:hypothetical protein